VALVAAREEAVQDAMDIGTGVLPGAEPGVVAECEPRLVATRQVCLAALLVSGRPQPLVMFVSAGDQFGDRL
jgi:hypothetical protein